MALLGNHGNLVVQLDRVMGADLGTEAVLEGGDDAAAVGVVLGVGGRHQQYVQRQPQDVATHLDIALLHHVEQRHLDALGQVGQLVDGHDPAVAARYQSIVDRLGITEAASLGHLDGVDVAHQVTNGGVRGGELFRITLAAVAPADRQLITELGGAAQGGWRDRLVRVLPQLGSGDHRCPFVEQACE